MHFAQSAAGNGEILAHCGNKLAVYITSSRDHRVCRYVLTGASKMLAAVADMHAGFLKSFRLKESAQTFARRQQSFLMARLYLVLPACDDNFPAALAKLLYLGGLHSSHLSIAVLAHRPYCQFWNAFHF